MTTPPTDNKPPPFNPDLELITYLEAKRGEEAHNQGRVFTFLLVLGLLAAVVGLGWFLQS